MPITFGYEGPLINRGVGISALAGRNQAMADARRFAAQLQQQYDQMSQQRFLEQQRAQSMRYMQQAQLAGQMQRDTMQMGHQQQMAEQAFARQKELAALEQQNRLTMQQDLYDRRETAAASDMVRQLDRDRQLSDLQAQYHQEVLNQDLDAEGRRMRQRHEQMNEMLANAHAAGDIDDVQFEAGQRRLLENTLGFPFWRHTTQLGEPGTRYRDPQTREVFAIGEDGQPHSLGEERRTIKDLMMNGEMELIVDPQSGQAVGFMGVDRNNRPFYQQLTDPNVQLNMLTTESNVIRNMAGAYQAIREAVSLMGVGTDDEGNPIPQTPQQQAVAAAGARLVEQMTELLGRMSGQQTGQPAAPPPLPPSEVTNRRQRPPELTDELNAQFEEVARRTGRPVEDFYELWNNREVLNEGMSRAARGG